MKKFNPNKYIISNGKFTRNFSKMYQDIKDPWNQKKNFSSDISITLISEFIEKLKKNKKKINILDIGAGENYLKKKFFLQHKYIGTDIHNQKKKDIIYDDIRIFNKNFKGKFDLIFVLKTIYYVGDKIDNVIRNINLYLKKKGILIISYNLKKDSYSNKFLTDLKLRRKLLKKLNELHTIEINRIPYETKKKEKITVLIFKRN